VPLCVSVSLWLYFSVFSLLSVSGSARSWSQRAENPVVLEALRRQESVEPLKLSIVRNGLAAAQALLQRRLDQRVVVDDAKHLVQGTPGDVLAEAGALNLHPHAQPAAPPHRGFGACDGFGHAHVVDGALLAQARDRVVDRVRVVLFAREALAHLRL